MHHSGGANSNNVGDVSSPSAWAVDLGNCLSHFRGSTLAKLGVSSSSASAGGAGENGGGGKSAAAVGEAPLPPSAAAALAVRLSARLALLAVRHSACRLLLLPSPEASAAAPPSGSGASSSLPTAAALQLAADLAHVEASISESLGSAPPGSSVVKAGAEAAAEAAARSSRRNEKEGGERESGNPRYYSRCDAGGALRAARKLLFVPSAQLFSSSSSSSSSSSLALLRSIPAPERAVWLLSRCPSALPRSRVVCCGQGEEGGDPASLARWLDDSRAVLLSGDERPSSSSSSASALAGRVRAALREAGSAPELEEGWTDLRAEIEGALGELEEAAAELLQLSAAREA